MASRIVIDGNAFYEIDEECMQNQKACRGREACDNKGHPPDSEKKRKGYKIKRKA